jgi:hypothetical protein
MTNENNIKEVGFIRSLFSDENGATSSRIVTLFICLFFVIGMVIYHEMVDKELTNGRLTICTYLINVVIPICLGTQAAQNVFHGVYKSRGDINNIGDNNNG